MLAFLLDPEAVSAAASGRAEMHPTRLRLISVATRLFQQRGYHAIGLAEILALSETPKGSLYHHFPGGKPELAEACVARIADSSVSALDKLSASGLDIVGFLRSLADGTAEWLQRTDWLDGSLLAVIGQEQGGAGGPLSEAVRIAYQRVEMRLARWLMAEGVAVVRARDMAATIIAAQEGALVLARSRHDAAPVRLVTDLLCVMVERG